MLLGGRVASCLRALRKERLPLRLGNGLDTVKFRAIDALVIAIGIDWVLGFLGNVLIGKGRGVIVLSTLLPICTQEYPFSAVLMPSHYRILRIE